ncbi:hypothetical protein sos41_11560 [Alphaproteobacteria bacterium SO-S41]|nr:hypothetical protein sos41_11560 [Alphaproteobacteria bacterium SO-S41]
MRKALLVAGSAKSSSLRLRASPCAAGCGGFTADKQTVICASCRANPPAWMVASAAFVADQLGGVQ